MTTEMIHEQSAQSLQFTFPKREKNVLGEKKPKIIVIAGPTGVGKTAISLTIARVLQGEIISADSMQVYQGMDIGTAKVSKEIRQEVPHHLIDIRKLDQSFNVMEFYEEATAAIHRILGRGHVPIIVGGTGFYIHALLYGPPAGPPSSPAVRQHLEHELKTLGTEALYKRLHKLDPDYAVTITQSDRHKIVRALEIISLMDKQVSRLPVHVPQHEQRYDFRCWFLYLPKELLYPRIEARCEEMLAQGFIEEVKTLENQGLSKNLSASQAIGYRQCLDFLRTAQSPEDYAAFLSAFKSASRRYAKRQLTWFRKEPLFQWLTLDDFNGTSLPHAAELILRDFEIPS